MNNYFVSLITYLPLLITYGVGFYLALGRRQSQPRAAGLAAWAFALLIGELLIGNLSTTWLIAALNAQTSSGLQGDSSMQLALLNGVNIVRMLVHTLGVALLIRALFPPLPNHVAQSWLRWTLGILIGLIVGGAAGALLGDPISAALHISNFEGGRGYFVIFLIIPGLALLGAIVGALVVGLSGYKSRA
ncbi:MAG: hypothetical protein R2867_19550 [Caldilineaceae bacterium]